MSLPVIEMKAKPVQAPEPVIFTKEVVEYQEEEEQTEQSEEDLDDCVHIGSGGGDDPPSANGIEEKEVFLPKEEEEVAEMLVAIEKETGKAVKKGKRAYNRKKPMSQKQLDHLSKIRAIGVEKRKERAKEAREKKILEQENQAEERLLKRKEKEEDDKILKDAKEAQKVLLKQNRPATAPVPLAYSQEDLEKACFNAVESYDNQRKVRKEAKKKKIAQEISDKNKVNMIQNAINPNLNQAPTHDPWRQFFT